MSDEEIIKRRLMFDGGATGDDRRLNVMVKTLAKWVNTPDTKPAEDQAAVDKVKAQIALCEHSSRRSKLLHKTNKKEMQKYAELRADYEKKISDIKGEITKHKLELEKLQVKQDWTEVDLLVKSINEQPSRMESTRKIVALQKEITELRDTKKKLDRKIGKNKEHLQVICTSANMLRTNIAEDKENINIAIFKNLSLEDITSSVGSEPTTE